MQQLFGTDGIRGRAGARLTPELALRAAFGFARIIGGPRKAYGRRRPLVLVGSDCRLSSEMLAAAVSSGLMYGGCDVLELGVLPTPAVSMLVIDQAAAGGVMITASHNPVADNGLKFFGADGIKLPEAQELAIEQVVLASGEITVADQLHFGKHKLLDPAQEYLSFVRRAVRSTSGQPRLKVLLDCAHGATCALAPAAYERAGYRVEPVHCTFDGARVNVKCGATDVGALSRHVRKAGADLGLAFDGDGDRVIAVDERGRQVSGDKIVALFATQLSRYRRQRAVVMTQMTNMGVEEGLSRRGIRLMRTEVGDINVLAAMRKHRLNLGGEQSGHIILRDKLPAGDGILTGLQLAAVVRRSKKTLGALADAFEEYPQVLTNLTVHNKLAWQQDKRFMRAFRQISDGHADVRFYLRPSGTEDVVRVLTEARDPQRCRSGNELLCEALRAWDTRKR